MATFEVIYQAAGAATGKIIQMDVYKPDHTKDVDQSAELTEIGTTGRYYGSFDADAPDWSAQISDNVGGKVVKSFGKDTYGAASVITLVGDIQTAVNAVADAVSALDTLVSGVDSKVDILDTNVDGIKAVTDTLTATLSSIEGKIDALESPPMIG